MKISIRLGLAITALVAIAIVFMQRIHVQANNRVQAAQASADSWTRAEVRSLSHRSYYEWLDDNGPQLSVGSYQANVFSPVVHVDLHCTATPSTVDMIARFRSVRTLQLCGTRFTDEELERLVKTFPKCYIAGFNTGRKIEFNIAAKQAFPWSYKQSQM